jgi:BirA family transcriptional regulator, biotin operon repressor / biotin---[acetyl-CoA-carboxylase] ligase
MCGMNTILSPKNITALCRPAAQSVNIQVIAETGSTNADLLAQIDTLSGATLLVAEKQTAGRGRAGRTWLSAPGATLTFSVAWKFNRPVQEMVGLPLAVGVALAHALDGFDVTAQLKWPNDLLRDGKKLGGTLIETAIDKQGNGMWAVIGIGLNLVMPAELAAQIDRPVTDAPELARQERNALMAALLSSLSETLIVFEEQGFKAFMKRWNALHAYAGEPVIIQDRDRVLYEGIAVGTDASGCLLLDTANGRIAVMAGDVSLHHKK